MAATTAKDGKVVKIDDDLMSATRVGLHDLRFARTFENFPAMWRASQTSIVAAAPISMSSRECSDERIYMRLLRPRFGDTRLRWRGTGFCLQPGGMTRIERESAGRSNGIRCATRWHGFSEP